MSARAGPAAADFTEIAFDGEAAVGSLVEFRIAGHDGHRARGQFP
ncbi:MAG: hypothetical protein WDM85_04585 [Caulobacteraceae bacterium]